MFINLGGKKIKCKNIKNIQRERGIICKNMR